MVASYRPPKQYDSWIDCALLNRTVHKFATHLGRFLDTDSNITIMRTSFFAGIAQLVERNLAKVEVASSSLVSRSTFLGEYLSFPHFA